MPTSITCESCGRRLLIGWAPNYELTCPHCMARFRNPNYGQSPPVPEATAVTAPSSAIHDLPDRLTQLQRHESRVAVADMDTDVRRDLSMGNIVLGVLIGLCVLGTIVAFAATPRGGYGGLDLAFVLMFIFAALDVLVSIVCIRAFVRWGMAGVRVPSALSVIGLTFLSLVTIVAVVIVFFMTCWGLAKMK
jgi:hypothetical protein